MQADHAVQDLANKRVWLREDIIVRPWPDGDKPGYLIEDPVNSTYFRVGVREYTFISLLDGNRSVADAMACAARNLRQDALAESEAIAVCKWLVESQLAHTERSVQTDKLVKSAETAQASSAGSRYNPFFIKLPLHNPDSAVSRLHTWLSWFYSWPFFVIWLMFCAWGLYEVLADWNRFAASTRGVFSPGNWICLGLAWALLKLVHELSHALVCKRYGGVVRETGVVFVLFAPMAYVDVTSCWRFPSKWQRIHTSLAGIYVELFVSALAVIVWTNSEAGLVQSVAYNVIFMASIATIVFNANPLMRFDGYYVLADLLDIPNLYSTSQQYLTQLAGKYLLGVRQLVPAWPLRRKLLLIAYGASCMVWRIIVYICLTVAATTLFHGAGIVLAVMGTAFWLGPTCFRLGKYLFGNQGPEPPDLARLGIVCCLAVSLLSLLLFGLSWPGRLQAPAVVQYASLAVVRARCSSFLHDLHARDAELVQKDQMLAELSNPEIETELADLALAIKQSVIRGRVHYRDDSLAAYQVEQQRRQSLEKQLIEKQQQAQGLRVKAPASGRVIRRGLESLVGTYLEQGSEILSIGQDDRKELKVSIAQQDIDSFTSSIGKRVMVRVAGGHFQSTLAKIEPQASLHPYHLALCAALGGPVPVRASTRDQDAGQADETYEFLQPRFVGIVNLSSEQSSALASGQLASVTISVRDRTIGQHLRALIEKWVRGLFQARA